jgi:hypothetical protein
LGIDRNYLISILYEIVISKSHNAKLNMVEEYIEIIGRNSEKEKTYSNYGQWSNVLYKQMN